MELTVILPVYNGAKTLPEALASLREQDPGAPWEVVAVDDGSTDGTLAILEAAAADFPAPMRVLTGPNGGPGAARNKGLSAAEGTFVTFLDADDLYLPGALNAMLTAAREHKADLVLFDAETVSEDGVSVPFPTSDLPGGEMTARDALFAEPAPWSKLIRRRIFVDNPLRFPEGVWYEDLAMIPAVGAFADRIWYEKTVLYRYRRTPGSITHSGWSEKHMDVIAALDRLARTVPQLYGEAEVLAFRHLYGTFVWQAWEAGDLDAIRRINAFMKEKFPGWEKEDLIRREPWKRRRAASLFYNEKFGLIRLWKGGAK